MRTVTRLAPALLLASSLASPVVGQDPGDAVLRTVDQILAPIKVTARADGVDAVMPALRRQLQSIENARANGKMSRVDASAATARVLSFTAELLADVGRIDEAVATLSGRVAGTEFAFAGEEPLKTQLAESEIAQRLAALTGGQQEEPPPAVDEGVRLIVEAALGRGNQSILTQLGPSITEVLAAICLEATSAAHLLSTALEPYVYLCRVAPDRAHEVGLTLLAREGAGWPTVVASGAVSDSGGLFSDGGEFDAAALALAEKLISAKEVSDIDRAKIVRAVLLSGSNAPFAERAGLALIEGGGAAQEVLGHSSLGSWHQSLLTSSSPTARRWAAELRVDHGGVELLEELAASDDPQLRVVAARALESSAPTSSSAGPRIASLWKQLLEDQDEDVRLHSWESYAEAYSQKRACPVDPDTAADLALLFTSDEPRVALTSAADSPLRFIGWIGRSAGDERARGAALGRLVGAEDVEVSHAAYQAIGKLRDADAVVAATAAVDWKGRGSRFSSSFKNLLEGRTRNQTPSQRVALYAQLVQVDGLPIELLEALCPHGRGGPNDLSLPLDDLEPQRAVATYRAAARVHPRHAWEMRYDTDWARLDDELGRALAGEGLSALERGALGIARLAVHANPERVELVHGAIREVARTDVEAAADLASQATSALHEQGAACLGLVADLAKDAALPNGVVVHLHAPRPESPAYGQPVADAAVEALVERAARIEPGTVPFSYAGRNWIGAMRAHPRLFREQLVRRWAREDRNVGDAGAAAHAAGAMDLVEEMRERAAELLLNSGGYDYNVEQAISRLSGIPGTEIAPYLLAFASETQSQSARELVLTRLEQMARVKDMEARFGGEASPEAKRAQAVKETLALLEHSNEAVRVQAIRGLATLGAVEELPRLIGFVSDGSKAEKEAALAALDALHDKATSAK